MPALFSSSPTCARLSTGRRITSKPFFVVQWEGGEGGGGSDGCGGGGGVVL